MHPQSISYCCGIRVGQNEVGAAYLTRMRLLLLLLSQIISASLPQVWNDAVGWTSHLKHLN